MRDINAFALRFPVDHGSRSSPNTIVLISGDGDFSQTLHQLSDQGFNIVIIENPIGASEEMKASASEVHQWKSIVSVAGNVTLPSPRIGLSEPTTSLAPSPLPSTSQIRPPSSRRVDFGPLITTIECSLLHDPSNPRPRQAVVAQSLLREFPNAYATLEGEQTWDGYVSFAKRLGIVQLGTLGPGLEWIALRDAARTRAGMEPEVVSPSTDLFGPLVTILESFGKRNPTDGKSRRSPVASALIQQFPKAYDRLEGEKSFKNYSLLAEKEGIVELGSTGVPGFEWIRLLPKGFGTWAQASQKNFLPLVRILSKVSSTRRATHSHVRTLLSDDDFLLAGAATWKEYLEGALAAGVIEVEPTEHPTVSWIALVGHAPPPSGQRLLSLPPTVATVPPTPYSSIPPSNFGTSTQARQLVEVLLTLPFNPRPLRTTVLRLLLQQHPDFEWTESFSSWTELALQAERSGIVFLGFTLPPAISLVRDHPLVVDATQRAFDPTTMPADPHAALLSRLPSTQWMFIPLLIILQEEHRSRPLRAPIAHRLKTSFRKVYSDSGFEGWTTYSDAARRSGLVTMGVGESLGSEWISLA